MGKQFLKCQQEDCEWNIGWLSAYEFTKEGDKGTRVCNLGAEAIIVTHEVPPDDCQQPSAVLEMAHAEFQL